MSKQVRYVNILMLIFLSAINNFIMTTAVVNTVISMSMTLLLYHINIIVVIIINRIAIRITIVNTTPSLSSLLLCFFPSFFYFYFYE